MKLFRSTILVATLATFCAHAQDEGAVVKRERIEHDKGIFIGGGISIPGGSNLGDYGTGINFEGGFMKRMNRVFSIGGSLSYLSFGYEPATSTANPQSGTSFPPNFYFDSSLPVSSVDEGYLLTLSGGDVSIISLAANLKLNFVPVKDNSVISVYAFAKPFVAFATVSALSGVAQWYEFDGTDWINYPSFDESGAYESETSFTGGVFVGPGLEINPGKPVSIFFQASFGYTFPLDLVSTKSYGNDWLQDLASDTFPLASFGFTSINFAAGISFNLD